MEQWLSWAMEIQSLAQAGLAYTNNVYDIERYERLRRIAAEIIDVCNGTHVSNIERGLYGLSLPRLVQVCKALHVNADYLLFGTSSNDIETALHAAIEQLNGTQKDCLIEIIRTYCKA